MKLFRSGVRRSLVAALLVVAAPATAHVMLDEPNGGEVLDAGGVATIQWQVLIGHDTLNWDLWYSITGPSGPWIVIAEDLPPGDISSGAVHTFTWTVPLVDSDQVRVRVRQDNSGNDYEDLSDDDFTIHGLVFVDGFEDGTTGEWTAVVP
jgi:hypothetical protein